MGSPRQAEESHPLFLPRAFFLDFFIETAIIRFMKKGGKKKETASFEGRRFGVILEDINNKFDQVLEGHASLETRMDRTEGKFDEFVEETRWNFKQVLGELKSIKAEIADLRYSLKAKADLARLEELEKRIYKIEETLRHR